MSAVTIPGISAAQRQAREAFDVETVMASLPPSSPPPHTTASHGAVGRRPEGHLMATLPDGELRAVARDCLGAQRVNGDYLQALRVVLGNQAMAERKGHVLELNIRTDFATERVMRTIINQMKAAGITSGKRVGLGSGRAQVIQVFEPSPAIRHRATPDLCAVLRREEARHGHRTTAADIPACISEEYVPY